MTASNIEKAILSVVGHRWTKVAMVIAKVADAIGKDLSAGDEGCEVISGHVDNLIRNGRLEARGDTKEWRFSEVRLAGGQ